MTTKEEITAIVIAYENYFKTNLQKIKSIFNYPMLRKSFEAIPTVLNYIASNYEEVLLVDDPEPAQFFAAGFEELRDSIQIIDDYLKDYKTLDNLNKMHTELNYLFLLNEFLAYYSDVMKLPADLMNSPLAKAYEYILDAMQNKQSCTEEQLEEINQTIDDLNIKNNLEFKTLNDLYEEISLDLQIPILLEQ